MNKVVGKLRIKEFPENLFTSQTIQKRQRMLLDWALYTSLIQKRSSHSYQSKHRMCFYGLLGFRITIVALVLQLIWYYSTSWISNKGDLVLVLIFWFRIIKCGWFFMLRIIESNFLKIGEGWAIVVKYATTVVYVGNQS